MNVIANCCYILFVICIVSSSAFALCGDVNGDGSILSNDVLMAARASIGTYTLTTDQMTRTDVVISGSPDGLILSNDLLIIARASLDIVIPVCSENSITSVWSNNYSYLSAIAIARTNDNKFIVIFGDSRFTLMKIDNSGNEEWKSTSNTYDVFDNYTIVSGIEQTTDGGYMITGGISSNSSTQYLYSKAFVANYTNNGILDWQNQYTYNNKSATAIGYDAKAISKTADGGFVIGGCGETNSASLYAEPWIFKVDSSGTKIWEREFVRSNHVSYAMDYGDCVNAIKQTSDNGYIIVGDIKDYFIEDSSSVNGNAWLVKYDNSQNIEWSIITGSDTAIDIVQIPDGSYLITGSKSVGGIRMAWIAKYSSAGSVIWEKTFSGMGNAVGSSIITANDDGYIIVGNTYTKQDDSVYERDAWIIKLDTSGNQQWERIIGKRSASYAYFEKFKKILPTSDNGYIIIAEKAYETSLYHAWIIKLDSEGNCSNCEEVYH